MNLRALLVISWCVFGSLLAWGQGGGRGAGDQAPPKDVTATDIPGIVAGGTKVQFLKGGMGGAQGATADPDGNLIELAQRPAPAA